LNGYTTFDAPPFDELWLPGLSSLEDDEALTPGTPRWWLKTLLAELEEWWAENKIYDDYYESRHRMAYASSKFREMFGNLFSAFADNWCPIVVDASVERLVIEGFRFGGDQADKEAWAIWQANNLDAESVMAHTEAVKLGCSALIVDVGETERFPRITVEHPSQVIVASTPGDRRRRPAALKRWIDQDGYAMATVYLPSAAYKFRSERPLKVGQPVKWVERPREAFEVANPLGVVPVIPLRNNPGMLRGGRSDLQVGIPIQDAINKLCNDMLVASEFAAYRQRVMTGVEVPINEATGRPIKAIEMGVGRLFTIEDPNAKVFDLQATDLNNYVQAIDMYVQHLAAQTRTPPHYLLGSIVNASGDALKAAETGLVARTRRKIVDFSDSWEEALRLAFKIRGTAEDLKRAEATDAEAIWHDPENKSTAELVDAGVKKRTIGIPFEVVWADMGYSPQQVQRMKNLAGLPDRPPPGATLADAVFPSGVEPDSTAPAVS